MRRWPALAVAVALAASAAAQGALAQGTPDNTIDDRVRASAEAAQAYQGQLDGAWTLTDGAGRPIYDFQLVERDGGGDAALEGVFRDLRGAAVPGDIGFIDTVARTGGLLNLAFRSAVGGAPVTVTLHTAGDGAWPGELHEAGAVTPVKLVRGPDF